MKMWDVYAKNREHIGRILSKIHEYTMIQTELRRWKKLKIKCISIEHIASTMQCQRFLYLKWVDC